MTLGVWQGRQRQAGWNERQTPSTLLRVGADANDKPRLGNPLPSSALP